MALRQEHERKKPVAKEQLEELEEMIKSSKEILNQTQYHLNIVQIDKISPENLPEIDGKE